MVSPDTVRLSLPRATELVINKIRVTLVTDLAGNYIKGADDLVGIHEVVSALATISIADVTATATDTIEVVFDGKLANVDSSDFHLDKSGVNVNLVLDTLNYNDDGQTEATFKIADDKKVPEDVSGYTLKTLDQDNISSQDAFGAKVTATTGIAVTDAIKPTVDVIKIAGSSITVKFNEFVTVENIPSVVTVKVDGTKQTVTSLAADDNKNLKINVALGNLNDTALVEVNLLSANDTVKAVKDVTKGNAATSFQRYLVYGEAKDVEAIKAEKAIKDAEAKVIALEDAAKNDLTVEANLKAAEAAIKPADDAIKAAPAGKELDALKVRFNTAKKTVEDARTAFNDKAAADQAAVDAAIAKVVSPIAKVTGKAVDTANATADEKITAVKGYVETLVDATTNGLTVVVVAGTTTDTYKVTITKNAATPGVKDNVVVTAFEFSK
jgi:hypothetical protein